MNIITGSIFLIIPFVFFDALTNSFDLAKNAIFRSLILALIYAHGAFVMYRQSLKIDTSRFRHIIARIFSGIFAVFIISTLSSATPLVALFGNYQRQLGFISWIFLFIFFIMLLGELNSKKMQQYFRVLLVSGFLVAAYGLLQKMGINPLFPQFDDKFFEGRIYSALGNPDFLAQFVMPLIFFAGGFFLEEKGKMRKALYIFCGAAMLGALLLTQSRASFLAFACVGGMVVIEKIIRTYRIVIVKQWKRGLTGIILMGCLGAALFFGFQKTHIFERFKVNNTNLRSVESRLVLWRSALHIIKDHPLLGTGIDTFSLYFPSYAEPKFFELEESLNMTADREHNELLQFGIWGGIPAMVLYASLFFAALRIFIKQKAGMQPLEKSIFLAFFAFIIQNQFTFSSLTHYVILVFLLASMVVITQKKEQIREVRLSPLAVKILFVLLIAIIPLLWRQTVLIPLQTDQLYLQSQWSDADKEARKSLEDAIKKSPYYADFFFNLIQYPDAAPAGLARLKKIVQTDNLELLAWEGNYYARTNMAEAMKYYERALKINPNYPPLLRAVGDALYRDKDCANAIEFYEKFLETAPQFWRWKDDLKNKTAAEQKSYRIFFKNEADFPNTFVHLAECYRKSGNSEKAAWYEAFIP